MIGSLPTLASEGLPRVSKQRAAIKIQVPARPRPERAQPVGCTGSHTRADNSHPGNRQSPPHRLFIFTNTSRSWLATCEDTTVYPQRLPVSLPCLHPKKATENRKTRCAKEKRDDCNTTGGRRNQGDVLICNLRKRCDTSNSQEESGSKKDDDEHGTPPVEIPRRSPPFQQRSILGGPGRCHADFLQMGQGYLIQDHVPTAANLHG